MSSKKNSFRAWLAYGGILYQALVALLGMLEQGKNPTAEDLAGDFNWPAVKTGFEKASAMTYAEAHAELLKAPDGTPGENQSLFPGGRPQD